MKIKGFPYRIAFLLFFFRLNNPLLAATCRDNVCESPETPENCPWDCRIANLDKDIKIEFPVYSVNKIIHYKADGSKSIIENDPAQIKKFLVSKIDFVVGGSIAGTKEMIYDDPSFTGVAVAYFIIQSLWLDNSPFSQMVDADETAFVHAKGVPPIKENRLFMRDYFGYSLMDPGSRWRDYYANQALEYLKSPSQLDGIFVDNALGRLITSRRFVRLISNEPNQVQGDGKTILFQNHPPLHTPEQYYSAENPIKVTTQPNGSGPNLFTGGSYTSNSITLGVSVLPNQQVYVTYYVIDVPDDTLVNNWGPATQGALQEVHNKLGGKLAIYNGVVASWTEDNQFPTVTDGGMAEDFIYPPWAGIDSGIIESYWKTQVDELKTISKDRVYLGQGGVSIPVLNDVDEQKFKKKAMFAFASYLLGKNKFGYFNFTMGPNSYQNFIYFDYWGISLGMPLEEDYRFFGRINNMNIYQRQFEQALVFVNPSTTPASALLTIPEGYAQFWDEKGEVHDLDGKELIIGLNFQTGILLTKSSVPKPLPVPVTKNETKFLKFKNFFNPAKGEELAVAFELSEPTHVSLKVVNHGGTEIKVLVDEQRGVGPHTIFWDGRNTSGSMVAAGSYILILKAAGQTVRIKVAVIK